MDTLNMHPKNESIVPDYESSKMLDQTESVEERTRQPDKEVETDDRFLERLKESEDISAKIQSVKKLDQTDRKIFASNLGRLFEKIQSEKSKFTFASLFDLVCGGDSERSLSMQKKRYRYILLSDDTEQTQDLAAAGYIYVAIAKELDKLFESELNKYKNYALLHLIEGSSFESKESNFNKYVAKLRKDIDSVFEKLVEKVAAEVDLNWMDNFLSIYSVFTFGGTGRVESFSPVKQPFSMHASTRFANDDLNHNGIAPCVRLASLQGKHESRDHFLIKSDKFNEGSDAERLIACLENFIAENISSEQISSLRKTEEVPTKLLDRLYEMADSDSYENLTQGETVSFDFTKYIDLEILFHEPSKDWAPYLIERWDILESHKAYDEHKKMRTITVPDQEPLYFIAHADLGYTFIVGYIEEQDGHTIFHYHELDTYKAVHDDIVFSDAIPHIYKNDDFYELLWSTESFGHLDIDFRDLVDSTGGSPYMETNLAQAIIWNIINSVDDQNIANKLVADAKDKYDKLKEFSKTLEGEYQKKLNAFLASNND